MRPGNGSKRLWIAAAHLPESQCKGRGVDLVVGLESVHAAVARNVRPGILRELAQGRDDAFRISGKARQAAPICVHLPEAILAAINRMVLAEGIDLQQQRIAGDCPYCRDAKRLILSGRSALNHR